MEYLTAEVLELAGIAARVNNLQLAIRNDEELVRCHNRARWCFTKHSS